MNIVAIGEILWDVIDKDERLGGAPFNVAAHCARLGHQAIFVSAVGEDDRGRRAIEQARKLGVETGLIKTTSRAPTGHVAVQLEEGQPDYRIHRPAAYDYPSLTEEDWRFVEAAAPDWLVFGTLSQTAADVFELTKALVERLPEAGRFYDVNLRKDSYSRGLIASLLELTTILKINRSEILEVQQLFGEVEDGPEAFCRRYAERYELQAVCVTQGEDGSLLYQNGAMTAVRGFDVEVRDAVGAGDSFSAAFLHGLSQGWPAEKAVEFGNRVGALVVSRSGAIPEWTPEEAYALK